MVGRGPSSATLGVTRLVGRRAGTRMTEPDVDYPCSELHPSAVDAKSAGCAKAVARYHGSIQTRHLVM